jgi:hypothetical protein
MTSSFSKLVKPKTELVISAPTDFRHVSRIGFNPQQGTFEVKKFPRNFSFNIRFPIFPQNGNNSFPKWESKSLN